MTTPPERDDVIDGLLRRMQPDAPGPAGDDCVDAERLARWAEGHLSGDERAAVVAHAVRCARCQALVSAMMRTTPADPAGPTRRSPWMLLRWGLPLAAAAALIAWFAVDRDVVPPHARERAEQQSSAAGAAKLPPPASVDVEAPRSTPPPTGRAAQRPEARAEARDVVPRRSEDAGALKDVQTETARAATPAGAAAPVERVPALSEPIAPPPAALPPAPPPGTLPPPPAQMAAPATAAPAAPQQIPGGGLAETVTVQSESASPSDGRRQRQGAWIDVHSADSLVRWRFTRRGEVERSADGGVTWTRERIPGPRAELTVGVAPSSSVCWLAGGDGIVLRFTTDRGWVRVPVPVRGDVDWLAASSAQDAWVRVGGKRFMTTDGGETWR